MVFILHDFHAVLQQWVARASASSIVILRIHQAKRPDQDLLEEVDKWHRVSRRCSLIPSLAPLRRSAGTHQAA